MVGLGFFFIAVFIVAFYVSSTRRFVFASAFAILNAMWLEIRDRLAAIRDLLIEHGIDPLTLPSPRGNGEHQ